MVSEFETLDKLNQINDALDANEIATAKDILMVLKDKYQTICDEFEIWAEEESKRQYELDFVDPSKTVTDCV